MEQTLLLDVDTGVDDAQALMLALRGGGAVRVAAVTCVEGNTSLDNVCTNTLRVLQQCGRLDIPVYRGCERNLLGIHTKKGLFHGTDGLGDVPDPDPPSLDLIQKEHAVNAIIRLVKERPGEIILVALGALTNIAMAIRLYPDLGRDLHKVYIMGGNLHGRGNTTTCAEFNFYSDPEAAHVVLNELNCMINLSPMELGRELGVSLSFVEEVRSTFTGSLAQFYLAISKDGNQRVRERGYQHSLAHDAMLMCAILDQSAVTETFEVPCSVERGPGVTRGMMVVDWDGKLGKPNNVRVIRKLDMDKVYAMYRKVLSE